jgi:hypothetical protein
MCFCDDRQIGDGAAAEISIFSGQYREGWLTEWIEDYV